MREKSLNGKWKMRQVGSKEWLEANVPGSVYADLIENEKMEDPYYRDNELNALKLMEYDYEYLTTFDIDEDILLCEKVLIRFHGLDTLADIFLNNNFIASVNNMHRTWEFNIKRYLRTNNNEIYIIFHSPTKFIKEAYEKNPLNGSSDAMNGFPHIRKAHCMFGWDWGPRLPDAGIWRSLGILGVNEGRIDNVYISQNHKEKKVSLNFKVDIKINDKSNTLRFGVDKEISDYDFRYKVTITSPDNEIIVYNDSINEIIIDNPKLWWPNGYGDQNLYNILIELIKDDVVIDKWENKIGLRTLTISREKDDYGESFAHVVNGVKIFAMGADYIPEDNILAYVNKERTYNLLKQCKDVNFNIIRVWGGGNYPYDDFFNICDELGLMVWQDFMFACAVYELNDEFEENITNEFIDNIRRIRHHACLALWCGNNEMEMFMDNNLWTSEKRLKADYIKLYEYIILKLLNKEDPQTFYWPASPSSGGSFDNPNDDKRGDVHYWDVWHGNKPITEYRKFLFRYVSEFGFQSFPSLKSVEMFTEPEDRNIFSYIMEKHQRNATANGKIMNYMEQTFLYPTNFDTLLYASQLLQAEAIRYGVEHFRRNRGICMGAIIWQLNDCWPVASWSSIYYYGRWKALHYYAKRFFAPLMLSCDEEGILTQDINPNPEPFEVKKSIHLCISNESMYDEVVIVNWKHRKNTGEIIKEKSYKVEIKKLSSVWLEKITLPELSLYDEYISYEMIKDNKVISSGTTIFCAPKHFKFINPNLNISVNGDEITILSDSYARSIEVINEEDNLLLEDNYFDINSGIHKVKIIKGEPKGLKVRSVYDIR